MKRHAFALLLFIMLLGGANAARADGCTASMSTVSFGSISPINKLAVQNGGTLSVSCSWLATTITPHVIVCLNLAAPSPRTLTNGTNAIQYDLYQDTAYSVQWGSTTANTKPIVVSLDKPVISGDVTVSTTVPVYGRITANQPTTPSVANSDTVYKQDFTAAQTLLNPGFYLLFAPSCGSVTATTGSFPFEANATVTNNCNITATNVAFASTGLLSNALSAAGALSVQCTNGDAYRISLDGGSSTNVGARTMQRSGGGGAVGYQLYLDSQDKTAWGDGSAGTTMVTGTGSGAAQIIPVYGVVPVQGTPAPGTYSDTITATISF
jgi:spore coat protein U-like protein